MNVRPSKGRTWPTSRLFDVFLAIVLCWGGPRVSSDTPDSSLSGERICTNLLHPLRNYIRPAASPHYYSLSLTHTQTNYSTAPMDQLGGGAAYSFRRQHHKRSPPSAERFLGILQPQSPPTTPPVELSEHDIFTTPSGSSSPSPTNRYLNPKPSPNRNQYGILAALNGNIKSRSGFGPDVRPVFNHKASVSASLSSSSSTSPATSISSKITIPRPPPPQPDRVRVRYQSAPVNIPIMPRALRNSTREVDDLVSEEEEDDDGVILPPHEVVASRQSPMLASSVLEGAGRTLKGRDLRQVRNAIWRKTGFIDS